MPPPGGGKRKRGDRSYSGDDVQRPSPHRPDNLNLAQRTPSYDRGYSDYRGRGGRRGNRGRNPSYNPPPNFHRPRDQASNRPDSPQDERQDSAKRVEDAQVTATELSPSPLSPPVDSSLLNYAVLTPEVRDDWTASGKKAIKEQCLEAAGNDDALALEQTFQELVWATLADNIPAKDVGEIVRAACEASAEIVADLDDHVYPNVAQGAFLDTISVVAESEPIIPHSRLALLVRNSGISDSLLRQELDAAILEKLVITRNTFTRMGIRKQTNVLYRQANFNLMREESEGFAKLMTELFTTSGSQAPSGQNVKDSVERVKAMIGAFDLDVGRSLDVVLDVFGSVLVKQFRFFVKFLRASPWWPRSVLSGGSSDNFNIFAGLPIWALPESEDWHLSEEDCQAVAQRTRRRDAEFWDHAREVGLQAYCELGQHKPADPEQENNDEQPTMEVGRQIGNKDAAQLLGFKLRFYSSSNARDESDVLPDNIIYLSALLIKIGFISLSDLYAHIWRSDDDMEELRQQRLTEKAERERAARPGAGARNALLMAGALADDTLPVPVRTRDANTRAGTPAKEPESEKAATEVSHDPADQKVLLLKSLLAIGALPEALFILGKFPWLLELYPEMPEYIHRIIHHSLDYVYSAVRPLSSRTSLHDPRPVAETELPGIPKGQVRLSQPPFRKSLRWALLDRTDSTDGSDYRFYWDEWKDNIPVCQTFDDVFTLAETLIDLIGVKIGGDSAILLKLSRIGKVSLKQDSAEPNRQRWLRLCKRYLLPALSLTKSNPGVVNEVFELISTFSTNTRYLMYMEWSSGRTSQNPDIKAATEQARAETKDVLKRISKTNVRPMARALARIAYANPHVVITTAIAQIEVYDSIADVFVEGARYFTELGYDVLTWAMITSMSKARSRTRQGGLFTSKWLTALANFAGKLYKRYTVMKSGPLLQYVDTQLGRGNSTDLIMLEQLIASMAGIASDINFNDAQLQAMGGGDLLQQQTLVQALDRRFDSSVKASSRRLMRALKESGLTGSLLISLAQQRQSCIYEDDYSTAPLKLLGMVFDDINQVMVQYLELLKTNLNVDDFTTSVPDVASLLISYQMPPEIAFWIGRPALTRKIAETNKIEAMSKKLDGPRDLPNGDVDMSDVDEEEGEEIEAENVTETTAATPTAAEINEIIVEDVEAQDQHWHPILEQLMQRISDQLSSEVVDIIGTGFFVTFWHLTPYDIEVPSKSYDNEVSRINKRIKDITIDKSDVSLAGRRKREDQTAQLKAQVEKLLAENKQHLKAVADVRARLSREKAQWFTRPSRPQDLNSALMEYCFLPRILFSSLDAYFCWRFVKYIHQANTPGFKTVSFYDLLFKHERLASLIFSCSAKETDNLGRFLCEALREFGRWHQNKAIYEKEAFGSKRNCTGFTLKPGTLLNYEDFRRVLFKWHTNLYQALAKCLESNEYMHIRNAISVLRAVSLHFPVVNFHGTKLVELLKKLGDDGSREDLQLSSKAVLGSLHRREKQWIIIQAFRSGAEKIESKSEDSPASEAKPEKDVVMADAPKVERSEPKPATPKPVEPMQSEMTKVEEPAGVNGTSKPPAEHELPKRIQPSPRPARSTNLPSRPDIRDSRPPRSYPERPPEDRSLRRPDERQHRHERDHGRPREEQREYPRQDLDHSRYENRHRVRPEEARPVNPRPDLPVQARLRQEEPRRPDLNVRPKEEPRSNKAAPPQQRPQDIRLPAPRPAPIQPAPAERPTQLPPVDVRARPREEPRPSLTPKQEPVAINPERAALIEESIRGQGDRRPERPDSRSRYPRPVDMQKGRLEQDFPPQEAPSGPRARGPPRPPVQIPAPPGPRPHTRNSSTETADVHPDRLKQIAPTDERRPLQSPPAGPRNNAPANAPLGPSPTTRAPPAGPQTDRNRRHQLTAVNTTLQQSQAPRGRGGRPSPVTPHVPNGHEARELFMNGERSSRKDSPERSVRREDDRRPKEDVSRMHGRDEIYERGSARAPSDRRPRRGA